MYSLEAIWSVDPIINSRGVWENSRFEGERVENGAAELLNGMLEDGSYWDDDEETEEETQEQNEALPEEDVASGAGMWRLNEDGTFELLEPYRSKLDEARVAATTAWTESLVAYLEENSPYSSQELVDELVKRNSERNDSKVMVFEEFVLEALSGEL